MPKGEIIIDMGEFIVKYWLEFLFGGIIAVLGFFCRHYWSLYKKEQKEKQEQLKSKIMERVEEDINALEEKSDRRDDELGEELGLVKRGVLSLQGHQFIDDCHELLDPNHVITLDEYEYITDEHMVYNSLGGNHNGDKLYNLIERKVSENTATTINPEQ